MVLDRFLRQPLSFFMSLIHYNSFIFLGLAILFSLSYTQYPLFSSNQNTYFLPGFACAGIGNLASDWLANTRDATPLFSLLVCQSIKWFHNYNIFYFYYGILQAIYFIIFYKLIQLQTRLTSFSRQSLAVAATFLLHAAGTRFVLGRILGADWMYVLEGGLANQRMLGSVFQPSVFGVLLLVSVFLALSKKWGWSIGCLALAAWFHPTYLLPSGLLLLAYFTLIWWENSETSRPAHKLVLAKIIRLGLFYILLILPVFIFTLSNFAFAPSDISHKASAILVHIRIPHHADINNWLNLTTVFQLGMLIGAFFLTRHRSLKFVLAVPFLLGLGLTLIQVLTRSDQLALLFPWRVSIVLVPLAMSIWTVWLIEKLLPQNRSYSLPGFPSNKLNQAFSFLGIAIILLSVLTGCIRFYLDLKRYAAAPEIPLYQYVKDHLSKDDLYLIPPKMENFRLSATAAVYADFKSSPYYAEEVVEWYRRLVNVNQFYKTPSCEGLQAFANEGVNQVVFPKTISLNCSSLIPQLETDQYTLYHLVVP